MSCREKKEIKFSVVKEIIIQWGRKICTVGRKDNAAKGRRGDTDRTCRGSVRTEIRQVFREGCFSELAGAGSGGDGSLLRTQPSGPG